MTSPRLTEAELPALYGKYYPRKSITADSVWAQAESGDSLLIRLRRWWTGGDNQGQYSVCQGERMLDIGCGSGGSLLYAQSKGALAYGIEADPNVQKLAKSLGLSIHQGNLADEPFPDIKFDLIIMNQVIEHIPEPDETLRMAIKRLAPNGRMVMVFPNRASLWCRLSGKRWINWHVPYHLHHFTMASFRRLAEQSGLTVTRHRTVTPNLWTFLQFRALISKPVQGVPNSLWRVNADPTPTHSTRRARSLRQVVVAVILNLFSIMNRCVDALGQGDCLLVELKLVNRS